MGKVQEMGGNRRCVGYRWGTAEQGAAQVAESDECGCGRGGGAVQELLGEVSLYLHAKTDAKGKWVTDRVQGIRYSLFLFFAKSAVSFLR